MSFLWTIIDVILGAHGRIKEPTNEGAGLSVVSTTGRGTGLAIIYFLFVMHLEGERHRCDLV